MESKHIREKFLEFFKKRGHAIVPSASLVPENDPTTLFTGSGMQPMVPYLLGQKHPLGKRIADSQKCFRAEDIDEVGDNRHTTFFEMLGNWSLGDYWKKEQLAWLFEFLTDENWVGLDPKKLYVTVFSGDTETGIPTDEESINLWKELFGAKDIPVEYAYFGSLEEAGKRGIKGSERIFGYGVKKNWWSRSGEPAHMPAGEPGGPDSEIFYDFGTAHDPKFGAECHPNCDCGRFLEIGNSVFMEYIKKADGTFAPLSQRNVDFGGGLERITAASNNHPDVFKIDVFARAASAFDWLSTEERSSEERGLRIALDHIRASVNLIADGVLPSNKQQGYVLRRLLRRGLFQVLHIAEKETLRPLPKSESTESRLDSMLRTMVLSFSDSYTLNLKEEQILSVINKEKGRFIDLLKSSYELKKTITDYIQQEEELISGEKVFQLFSTFGLPIEYIEDEAEKSGLRVNRIEFEEAFKKHQELSRTASAGAFKGGLADTSQKTTRLHTAHHLLLKALQIVLGPQVKQRGSNITSERLRLDFSHDAKMTEEQRKEVERMVNERIAEDLPVIKSEMPREEAEKLGAEHEFGQKYPERVSVYSIGPKSATPEKPQFEKAYSMEFCGGPHVARTGEIGKFRILKEEAVSAGVRRIKGVVE